MILICQKFVRLILNFLFYVTCFVEVLAETSHQKADCIIKVWCYKFFLLLSIDPELQALWTSDTSFVCLLLRSAHMERYPDVCSVSFSVVYRLCGVRLGKTKQQSTKAHRELSGLKLVLLSSPLYQKASLPSLMCRHLGAAGYDAPSFSLHSSAVSPADISQESA